MDTDKFIENRRRREAAQTEHDAAMRELVKLLLKYRGRMTVTEMADAAGISRVTAHKYLATPGQVTP